MCDKQAAWSPPLTWDALTPSKGTVCTGALPWAGT